MLEAMGFAAAVDRGGVVEQSVEHTPVAPLVGAVPAELHTTIVSANSSPTGTAYHA